MYLFWVAVAKVFISGRRGEYIYFLSPRSGEMHLAVAF
jgi:hypothetical protein